MPPLEITTINNVDSVVEARGREKRDIYDDGNGDNLRYRTVPYRCGTVTYGTIRHGTVTYRTVQYGTFSVLAPQLAKAIVT